jgi:hypothetical protein
MFFLKCLLPSFNFLLFKTGSRVQREGLRECVLDYEGRVAFQIKPYSYITDVTRLLFQSRKK